MVQRLEVGVLDSILSVDLLDYELTVGTSGDLRDTCEMSHLQSPDQSLVLGDVVGRLAEITAAGVFHRAVIGKENEADSSRSRITPGSAIRFEESLMQLVLRLRHR